MRICTRAASVAVLCGWLLAGCSAALRSQHDDLTISTKVKIELLTDPALGALRLNASTLNGVVTLSGAVATQGDADRAVSVAKRVPGVRSVKSELKIQEPVASSQLPVTSNQFPITSSRFPASRSGWVER